MIILFEKLYDIFLKLYFILIINVIILIIIKNKKTKNKRMYVMISGPKLIRHTYARRVVPKGCPNLAPLNPTTSATSVILPKSQGQLIDDVIVTLTATAHSFSQKPARPDRKSALSHFLLLIRGEIHLLILSPPLIIIMFSPMTKWFEQVSFQPAPI